MQIKTLLLDKAPLAEWLACVPRMFIGWGSILAIAGLIGLTMSNDITGLDTQLSNNERCFSVSVMANVIRHKKLWQADNYYNM